MQGQVFICSVTFRYPFRFGYYPFGFGYPTLLIKYSFGSFGYFTTSVQISVQIFRIDFGYKFGYRVNCPPLPLGAHVLGLCRHGHSGSQSDFGFVQSGLGFPGLSKSAPFGLYKSSVRDRFGFFWVRVGVSKSSKNR